MKKSEFLARQRAVKRLHPVKVDRVASMVMLAAQIAHSVKHRPDPA